MKQQWTLGFVFCLFSTFCSYPVFAASVEEASALYAKRGLDEQGVENAKKAAEMYQVLSAEVSSVEEKAYYLIKESEAHYFVGLVHEKLLWGNGNPLALLEAFDKGYKAGLAAVNLLGNGQGDQEAPLNPKKVGNEKLLALAMYWESANLLYWSKTKGTFAYLTNVKSPIKPRISDILRLDSKTMNYGVNRLAGEVIWLGNMSSKIQDRDIWDFLVEPIGVNELVFNGATLSSDMSILTLYLQALRRSLDENYFCDLYKALTEFMRDADDQRLSEMFPNLVPEAKLEYEAFMAERKNTKFYEKTCL